METSPITGLGLYSQPAVCPMVNLGRPEVTTLHAAIATYDFQTLPSHGQNNSFPSL